MKGQDMAWAIFTRRINWTRPKSPHTFEAYPSENPQSKPRDFIDAAVALGAAVEVSPPDSAEAKALKAKPVKRKP